MITSSKRRQIAREIIQTYAALHGDELSDGALALSYLCDHTSVLTDRFLDALTEEMENVADNYLQHSRIVKLEQTHVTIVNELVWDND